MTHIDPKTNEAFEDNRSDAEVARLLAVGSSQFGRDLAGKQPKYGWSDKQRAWAFKIAREQEQRERSGEAQATERAMGPGRDYTVAATAIQRMFDLAADHLKSPAMTFHTQATGTVKLYVGKRGKNAGAITIVDGGRYPDNNWYGTIRDGRWNPSRSTTPAIREMFDAIEANPVEVIAQYGKTSGRCCFCHTAITAPKSQAVGYGPTCADNFGLPYGDVVADTPVQDENAAIEEAEPFDDRETYNEDDLPF